MGCEYSMSTMECSAHSVQNHSEQYPVLAQMAQDYLPIQGSATPSKCMFSYTSLTDSKQHNWLALDTFEALQILKSAYHNGYMSALAESEKYYHSVMSVLRGEDHNADGLASLNFQTMLDLEFYTTIHISIYFLSCIYCVALSTQYIYACMPEPQW